MTVAIELKQLTLQTRDRHRKTLLKGLTATLPVGEVCGLVGHNGAGKTTLIRQILGLVAPTSGAVRVFGQNPRVSHFRSGIGYSPERPELAPELTVGETIELHHRLVDGGPWQSTAERCGLTAYLSTPIHRLSKGWQTRVSLSCATIGQPRLLVLDEPMSGLDPEARLWVRRLLQEEAARGTTVLFSSHSLSDVRELCASMWVLAQGQLRYAGSAAGLFADATTMVRMQCREVLANVPFSGTWNDTIWQGRVTGVVEPCVSWFLAQGARILSVEPEAASIDELVASKMREVTVGTAHAS
jgi:Cu-processing system ATP-binding protein